MKHSSFYNYYFNGVAPDQGFVSDIQDNVTSSEQRVEASVHPSLSIHASLYWDLWAVCAPLRDTHEPKNRQQCLET